MTVSQKSMIFSIGLLLNLGAADLPAQEAIGNRDHPCFTIHVNVDGKPVNGPQIVTFKTKEYEMPASLEGGCFRVPLPVLNEKTVDIFFTVPKNKVYLSAIRTGFFAGPWDVDLEDKPSTGNRVPAKQTRSKEACRVIFHVGEPEIEMVQTPCRTPY